MYAWSSHCVSSSQAALQAAAKRAADAADAAQLAADAALKQLGEDKDAVIAAERADASKPYPVLIIIDIGC